MDRIHYIYQTTNNINGKKYIGQRLAPKGKPIEKDRYLGSGTLLIMAVKKYGYKNFSKDILEICYSREEADRLEILYFEKFQVLEKREEFYNRGLPGQYWRPEGHSEFVSTIAKKYYSDPKNVDKIFMAKFGMTKSEYNEKVKKKRDQEKYFKSKLFKINAKIKNLKKERYKYYRELTKDLRNEFYTEKQRGVQKQIWETKKYDPEFLEATRKGKEDSDHFNRSSVIYDAIYKSGTTLHKTSALSRIRNYLSIKFMTKSTLESNIKIICEMLETNDNIIIPLSELTKESKIKYSHFYN